MPVRQRNGWLTAGDRRGAEDHPRARGDPMWVVPARQEGLVGIPSHADVSGDIDILITHPDGVSHHNIADRVQKAHTLLEALTLFRTSPTAGY